MFVSRRRFFESCLAGYVVTTLFNFISLSSLLVGFRFLFSDSSMSTVLAHGVGMILSMFFTIDFWWVRVSMEVTKPVRYSQRVNFLLIAVIVAVLSYVAVSSIGQPDISPTLWLLFVNWAVIVSFSVAKYILFLVIVTNRAPGSRNLSAMNTQGAEDRI